MLQQDICYRCLLPLLNCCILLCHDTTPDRFGTKLAGRMAPRYAQDQLAGHTQQWAFPEADGLLTDTVAK